MVEGGHGMQHQPKGPIEHLVPAGHADILIQGFRIPLIVQFENYASLLANHAAEFMNCVFLLNEVLQDTAANHGSKLAIPKWQVFQFGTNMELAALLAARDTQKVERGVKSDG